MDEMIKVVISLIALAVSVVAIWYARRHWLATQDQSNEIKELRHEREQPQILVSAVPVGGDIRLVITNAGLRAVDAVSIQLTAVKSGMNGDVRPRALAESQAWKSGPLDRFQGVETPVSLARLASGQIAVVTLEARRGAKVWEWAVDVPLPAVS